MLVHVVSRGPETEGSPVRRDDVVATSLEDAIRDVRATLPTGWSVLYAVVIAPDASVAPAATAS